MKKITVLLVIILIFSITGSFSGIAAQDVKVITTIEDIDVKSDSNSVYLNWKKDKRIDYFEIRNDQGILLEKTGKGKYVSNELEPDNIYSFYLVGYDEKGIPLTNASIVTIRTDSNDGSNHGLNKIITTSKSIYLEWSKVEGAKEYEIYKDNKKVLVTNKNYFTDKDIGLGEKYDFLIKAEVLKEHTDNGEVKEYTDTTSISTTIDTNKLINKEDQFTIFSNADDVTVRLMSFIDEPSVGDPYSSCDFLGDGDRNFSYYSSAYRTWQQVKIDFASGIARYTEDMGTTHKVCPDGSRDSGTASLSGLSWDADSFNSSSINFQLIIDAANPLSAAPAINAELDITVYKGSGSTTGTTAVTGQHDGFPNYELWRKDGSLYPDAVWLWDASSHNDGLGSLFPPMEHNIDVVD